MKNIKKISAVVLLFVMIFGCATTKPGINYDKPEKESNIITKPTGWMKATTWGLNFLMNPIGTVAATAAGVTVGVGAMVVHDAASSENSGDDNEKNDKD